MLSAILRPRGHLVMSTNAKSASSPKVKSMGLTMRMLSRILICCELWECRVCMLSTFYIHNILQIVGTKHRYVPYMYGTTICDWNILVRCKSNFVYHKFLKTRRIIFVLDHEFATPKFASNLPNAKFELVEHRHII